jgi:L-alanine-DL-glutamate epimerase-like enolase superfamily enzyme
MAKLHYKSFTLRLNNPFVVSYGASDTRQAFIIKIPDLDNPARSAFGEGTIPPYYRVDPTAMTDYWATLATDERPWPDNPKDIRNFLPDGPAPAKSAIDLALHDRIAKRANLPLHKLLALPAPIALHTSFTISLDEPANMAAFAAKFKQYPVLKLKLGGPDTANGDPSHLDRARVFAVRAARPDARIRVDANAAWTPDQAKKDLPWLAEAKVELIEQPLAQHQLKEMGELQQHTPIPILADESVQSLQDVKTLADAGVKGINLKLMKVGGLSAAVEILHYAKNRGLLIMLGSMIETSLGTTAMAQLSGAADFVDLDAPLLIANDPFTGITYTPTGQITTPTRPGLGATPHPGVEI